MTGTRRGAAPRITAKLNDGQPAGERVNDKPVVRVMHAAGIAGYLKKRRVRTTVPEPADRVARDLLKRDFTAEEPNRRYVGDINYLPLVDGTNLYLAAVIDCYSRRLAGWAIADHMRTDLVEDPCKAAACWPDDLTCRRPSSGGSSATTPAAATPGAAHCPRRPTRRAESLRCQRLRNQTPCPSAGGMAPGPVSETFRGSCQPSTGRRMRPTASTVLSSRPDPLVEARVAGAGG